MARSHRCQDLSLTALTLGVLIWTSAAAAGQSMAKDGYVLPPESVQDLFRRDKNIAALNRLRARTATTSSSRTSRSSPTSS